MATGNDKRQVTLELYDAIRLIFEQEMLDVFTAMPGTISSYDPVTKLAVVQPGLQVKYVDEATAKNRPLISNVPVKFPQMGKAHLRFPVKPGDEGMIQWSMRSIDQWISQGGLVDPGDNRRFDYSDAVFQIGATSQLKKIDSKGAPENLELVNDQMVIEMFPSGKIKIKNNTAEFLDLVDQLLTGLLAEPMIFQKGLYTVIQTKLRTLKG